MKSNNPIISFVIPTYNSEKYLDQCLASIVNLDYDKRKIEIIIIDGGSVDKTLEIAEKYQTVILENKKRIAEYGKAIGLKEARGDFIVLLDSDNIIVSADWLLRMLVPFQKDPEIFGVESFYLIKEDFSAINKYCNLLHVTDPLARILAPLYKITDKQLYLEYSFKKGQAPPIGANGFIYKKELIFKYWDKREVFEEGNFAAVLSENGLTKFARVKGCGIYHYYVNDLAGFVEKRRKIAKKFLNRKKQQQNTWVDKNNKWMFLIKCFYLATFIGPLAEAFFFLIKTRRIAWLWHPFLSFLTIYIYTSEFIKSEKSLC